MSVEPFWTPIQYSECSQYHIPAHDNYLRSSIVGMLCGSTVSGIVVAVSYILKEFQESKDKIEIYLAFGATRVEACRTLAVQALKRALTPAINNMRFVVLSSSI